jgi:hypothetical protein
MSKIKALITALVLGTSSLAAADTGLSFHASASWGSPAMTAPVVRDHRTTPMTYRAPVAPFARGTWISLAEPMNLARGRTFIDLNSRAQLNQLRLQSTSGQAFVSTVTVNYVNGASQVVTLNQWIDSRNPLAQFNLNRTTQVDSILINGSRSRRGGKFQVFGYASSTRPTPPIYQPERPPVYQPPVYQPPVYQPPVYQPVVAAPISVPLANNMTLWGSYGSKEILVDTSARAFNTLRIIGNTGSSPMSHIIVSFTNGHQQMMPINRTIIGGDKLDLTLDGAGRYAIARVTVYHNGTAELVGPSGWFSVAAL